MQKPNRVSLFKTLYYLGILRLRLKRQEMYFKKHIPGLINHITDGQFNRFSSTDIKRIRKYWQLSLNIVCQSMYKLTGRKLSASEQDRILLLSIFGPLYDDLFDSNLLSHQEIEAFTLNPENYQAVSFEEQVLKKIYIQILQSSPNRQSVIKHLHHVFEWQKASLKQMKNDITEEALYEITYKKSYYSFLLYYAILDHYPDRSITEMLYPVAGLLQLTNDIFDVYWDLKSNIYTIPNLYFNYNKLRNKFMADVALFNKKLQLQPYSNHQKALYAITILSLPAMGGMAIEQLKQVTFGISKPTELARLNRKQLICDMDSLSQISKWIQEVNNLTNYRDNRNILHEVVDNVL